MPMATLHAAHCDGCDELYDERLVVEHFCPDCRAINAADECECGGSDDCDVCCAGAMVEAKHSKRREAEYQARLNARYYELPPAEVHLAAAEFIEALRESAA